MTKHTIADRISAADEALTNASMEFASMKIFARPDLGVLPSQDELRSLLRWVNNAADRLRELRWHCLEKEKETT